ncbi:MAG: polyamine ABC transporter substrate-binding protein [Deltaproteobacteria bacterium]|nr:polyamine ABC transporter substrate-binding protein [Deltaproteobacteria bacterium]
MKKGYLPYCLIVSILIVVLIGVFGVGAAEKLSKDQVITIAFDVGDAKTFEPHRAAATGDRPIADMVFNGLVRYPPGNQVAVEPDLAKSWKVSKDGKIWTFELRKGVFFHPFPGYPNGYELTSEDVVYSFKRASTPDHSSYAGEYSGMTFEAVGPNTVKITIEKPVSEPLFLAKVASYAGGFIVSKKAIEEKGAEWFKMNPVGTGPFIFKSYEPRQKTVLVPNKNYFRGAPILKEVVIRYMPSVSSREMGLQTGELQIIEGLKEDKWVEKIAALPDVKVKAFGPCETQMLHFNMNKEPFNDIRVRKAISYAISREEVATFMGKGLAVPIYSPAQAPPAPGALTKEETLKAEVVYEDNIAEAKKLLAEAGYPNGFKTEVIISEMESSYKKPMIAIQAQLKKVGIDMALKVVDHSSFHSLIREDASPIVYYAAWRPNVDVFLTRFYHSDSVVKKGKKPDTNFSHYGLVDANGDGKTDSVDELIEKARWELDAKKQMALWKEAQIKLLKDVVVVPIIRLKYAFPMRASVDLGNPLEFSWATYAPQITEKTRILAK